MFLNHLESLINCFIKEIRIFYNINWFNFVYNNGVIEETE